MTDMRDLFEAGQVDALWRGVGDAVRDAREAVVTGWLEGPDREWSRSVASALVLFLAEWGVIDPEQVRMAMEGMQSDTDGRWAKRAIEDVVREWFWSQVEGDVDVEALGMEIRQGGWDFIVVGDGAVRLWGGSVAGELELLVRSGDLEMLEGWMASAGYGHEDGYWRRGEDRVRFTTKVLGVGDYDQAHDVSVEHKGLPVLPLRVLGQGERTMRWMDAVLRLD